MSAARMAEGEQDRAPAAPASATRRRLPLGPRYEACGGEAQARPCHRAECRYYLEDPAPWVHLEGEDPTVPDHVSCSLDVASVAYDVRNESGSVREVEGRDQEIVGLLLGVDGERVRQIVKQGGYRYAMARRRMGFDDGEKITGEDAGERRARQRRAKLAQDAEVRTLQTSLFVAPPRDPRE